MTFRKLPFFVFVFLVSTTFSLANGKELDQREDTQREHEGQDWGGQREEEGHHVKGEYKFPYYLFNREKLSKHLENPYLFKQENFSTHLKTQQGSLQQLQKFSQASHLLKWLENYRIEYLEINPNTFTLPIHWDADSICFVLNGQGAITLLQQENNKETHNLERGDIFRIRASTIFFIVSREKFRMVKLSQPINLPGNFDGFFGTGGKNPETFYSIFSKDILQAAFNVEDKQISAGLFQAQDKGPFVEASQEQIKALSGESSEQGGSESQSNSKPYNIFNRERPSTVSNKYGKLYIVSPDDYKQLEEDDIQISYVNITRGAMMGPYYNSKSIKICVVVNGNGKFEMASPHVSRAERKQLHYKIAYHKYSGSFSPDNVFVNPAAHPFVVIASNDENLELLCFDINARDNQRYELAGKTNILKQLPKVAMQLSFNLPAEQVEEIFNKRQESVFYPGPQQQEQEQGGGAAAADA